MLKFKRSTYEIVWRAARAALIKMAARPGLIPRRELAGLPLGMLLGALLGMVLCLFLGGAICTIISVILDRVLGVPLLALLLGMPLALLNVRIGMPLGWRAGMSLGKWLLGMRPARREAPSQAARPAETGSEQSPGEAKGLRSRAEWLSNNFSYIFPLFGFFLPRRIREKVLEPDLAEHRADLYAALAEAGSRVRQDWLILRFTGAAGAKVLACAGVALRSRLCDEIDWVAGRSRRK